jgi:hypothetical protein
MIHGAVEEGLSDGDTAVEPCCTGFLSNGFLRTGFHGCFLGGFEVAGFLSDGVVLPEAGFWPGVGFFAAGGFWSDVGVLSGALSGGVLLSGAGFLTKGFLRGVFHGGFVGDVLDGLGFLSGGGFLPDGGFLFGAGFLLSGGAVFLSDGGFLLSGGGFFVKSFLTIDFNDGFEEPGFFLGGVFLLGLLSGALVDRGLFSGFLYDFFSGFLTDGGFLSLDGVGFLVGLFAGLFLQESSSLVVS